MSGGRASEPTLEPAGESIALRVVQLSQQDRPMADTEELGRLVKDMCRSNNLAMVKAAFPSSLHPNMEVILHYTGDKAYTVHTHPVCVAVEFTDDIDLDILEYLLDIGATPDSKHIFLYGSGESKEHTILSYALSLRKTNAMYILLSRGAPPEPATKLLRYACCHMDDQLLKLVVDKGANLTEDKCYPLHWILPSPSSFQLHLDDMSTINFTSLLKNTKGLQRRSVNEFSFELHLDMVKYLLCNGCDPNRKHVESQLSAGHMVSRGHKVELYKLLLAHGWDIHTTDLKGWTALHYAAMSNDVIVMTYLVEIGARLDVRSPKGLLPLHATAIGLTDTIVLGRFQVDNCNVYPNDFNKAMSDVIDYVTLQGIDIDTADYTGKTLVEMMCGVFTCYKTLSSQLEKSVRIPFGGDIDKLENHCKNMLSFINTDCLMPAGFQCISFVNLFMYISILANNMGEYVAATYANPYALYKIPMSVVSRGMAEYEQLEAQPTPTSLADKYKAPILRLRRRIGTHRSKDVVYQQAVLDQQGAPSLKQLCTYCIRCQLLSSGGNRSLCPIIEQLHIPKPLKQVLSLGAFVDYRTPGVFRTD